MKESDYIKSGELVYNAFVKYKEALKGRPTDASAVSFTAGWNAALNHIQSCLDKKAR